MSDYLQHIEGKRIYFDVNLFIYALEPTQDMQAYFATVTQLFEMAVAKQIIADFFITQDKRLQTAVGLQKLTLDSLLTTQYPI